MKKRTKYIICLLLAIILTLTIGIGIYLGDYYRADETAVMAMSSNKVVTVETHGQYTIFRPDNAEVSLIFYPGGKVEHTAYAPLLTELAKSGIFCVLAEMPGNLAVLDMNAADDVFEQFPQIEHWYIGGHSLGGSMAASYAESHSDKIDGLVLLASYSTADLSGANMPVLSLYGTQDKVMNKEKYDEYKVNLPEDTKEVVIDGGNHSGFGNYGFQDGDGTAAISAEEQQQFTAKEMVNFFNLQ